MNAKADRGATARAVMLWSAVAALTALRLTVAASGNLNEGEALITLCAAHPAGGYVEGPAGVPLLVALNGLFCGGSTFALRWLSSLGLLLLSWCVWWIGRRLSPRRPAVALWSVLVLNLLPAVTLSSLIMDGALVTAAVVLLAVVAAWHAVEAGKGNRLAVWGLFGVSLGFGTLFCYPVGWLLPAALLAGFVSRGGNSLPWRGALLAAALLALGWVVPLAWNARHDWIQASSVAASFDGYPWEAFGSLNSWLLAVLIPVDLALVAGFFFLLLEARGEEPSRRLVLLSLPCLVSMGLRMFSGHGSFPTGLVIASAALLLPPTLMLALSSRGWNWVAGLAALPAATFSLFLLAVPGLIPPGFPSPEGVRGVASLVSEIVALREERSDSQGERPFLIASTPGLAALLGERMILPYPERPGAPSVFAAESPNLGSSFSLWPGYADAVAAGGGDPLYTEEKAVSPFLGRNALYITTESPGELPQTITGAFDAVGLLKECTLRRNARPVTIRIYQCEKYRSLSL